MKGVAGEEEDAHEEEKSFKRHFTLLDFRMGVQLALNLFAALPKSNLEEVTVASDTANSWADSKEGLKEEKVEVGLRQLQGSMDSPLEECSRDTIRNTMLKHERLFIEQVHELHRLYRVQKLLMAELSKEVRFRHVANVTSGVDSHSRSGFLSSLTCSQMSNSPSSTDRPNYTPQPNSEYNFNQGNDLKAGTSSLGLSSCSGETWRIQRGFNLERPTVEVFVKPLFGRQLNDNIQLDSLHVCNDEDSDLELTLSIGCAASRKISRRGPFSGLDSGSTKSTSHENRQPVLSNLSRMQTEEHGERDASFDSERLQRSPWVFQALSLNRT